MSGTESLIAVSRLSVPRYEVQVTLTRSHADTNRDYAWGVYDHGLERRTP